MISEDRWDHPVEAVSAPARRVEAVPASGSAQPSTPVGVPAAVEVSVLDALVTQLDPDGSGLRDMLLRTYLDDSAEQLGRLLVAADGSDLATVASIAHTVRSTSALLGANRLAELLRRAEEAARQDSGLVPVIALEIEAEHARVAECLQGLRGQPPVAAPG